MPVDLRLVPAAMTAWLVTAAGILWPPAWSVLVAALLTAATALAVHRIRPAGATTTGVGAAAAAVAVAGVTFALAVGIRAHDVAHHPLTGQTGRTVVVTVTPTESPRPVSGARVMFRGTLRAVAGHPLDGRVLVFASASGFGDLSAGRPAEFRARVAAPLRRDLTVAALSATGAPRLGRASVPNRIAADVRRDFAAVARDVLPGEQAALLPALALGDTGALPATTVADFRSAGLTHLTAVSGANVTIVCGAVLLSAMLIGPRAAVVLAGVALVCFVIVVQPSASVLRAAVMGAIALLAVASHRRRQAIPALATTVLVVMVGWPEMAVDVGFALSVVATAALVVVAPAWSARLEARGWPRPLAGAVAVAVAAQLVTAPLVAGISGSVSVIGVLANLAVAVVIPPITVLGTAAAALAGVWPAGAGLLIRFTGPELWWLLRVAHGAAAVPGAVLPVPDGPVGAALVGSATVGAVALARRRWGRVLLSCGACGVVAWAVRAGVPGA